MVLADMDIKMTSLKMHILRKEINNIKKPCGTSS